MKVVILAFALLQLLQCAQKNEKKEKLPFDNKKEYEQVMIQSHRAFLAQERARIEAFIDSTGKAFEKTGTGLRYHIYKSGDGDTLKSGDVAVAKYKLSFLNGEEIYPDDSSKIREFTVDFDNVESGLHEGVKYLHVGDRAIFIMPAHLAYGITGDHKSIPSQSTLVFDFSLLDKK